MTLPIDHQNLDINTGPAGMPALDASGETVSWFEFAPAKYFYIPIAFYWVYLSVKFRGVLLPTGANPALPHSGLVGESKKEVLDSITGASRDFISPYIRVNQSDSMKDILDAMTAAALEFPLVAKPDLGMRGAGVQKIKSQDALEAYIQNFPAGGDIILQKLADREGEAGVYYIRHPDWDKGQLISLTLKYFPYVMGDGRSTLGELISNDPRAGQVIHLYSSRFQDRWHSIPDEGEAIRLAFAGNHSQGTIFRNGNDLITEEMTAAFDQIARDMGEFYVGRFDIRFDEFADLQQGQNFTIIEVNGAGGEATHIWDSRTTLRQAYKSLMNQFHHIFTIGYKNRKRGFKPSRLRDFFKDWQKERRLTADYPDTH